MRNTSDALPISVEGRALSGGRQERLRLEMDPRNGLLTEVGKPTGKADILLGDEVLILPGLIDLHVHAREDDTGRDSYKEDFQSAGEAAIHGGVTAIADMPNNPSPPIDLESYSRKREIASSSPVDVLVYCGIGPETKPLSVPAPYKVYMGPSVGDLFFENNAQLHRVLPLYRGEWVVFHAESPEVLRSCRDRPTHGERRPARAEIEAVELALELAVEYGFTPHIAHLSTEGGLEAIRDMRRRGFEVTCEVTPHHLYFDQEGIGSQPRAGYFQCNPPIRSRKDREALLAAFRDGEIDFLASDHAPHSLEENEKGISGIPHLDTLGPFLFWLREEGVSWETLCKATSENPGKIFERFLPGSYGRIETGAVASLTILDTSRPVTIRRSQLRTRAGWSPFEGLEFSGSVLHTVVRGRVFSVGDSRTTPPPGSRSPPS